MLVPARLISPLHGTVDILGLPYAERTILHRKSHAYSDFTTSDLLDSSLFSEVYGTNLLFS